MLGCDVPIVPLHFYGSYRNILIGVTSAQSLGFLKAGKSQVKTAHQEPRPACNGGAIGTSRLALPGFGPKYRGFE
jgi:hypothetical protein